MTLDYREGQDLFSGIFGRRDLFILKRVRLSIFMQAQS